MGGFVFGYLQMSAFVLFFFLAATSLAAPVPQVELVVLRPEGFRRPFPVFGDNFDHRYRHNRPIVYENVVPGLGLNLVLG